MTDELQKKIVWQNINSSKEKGKILTGKIIAIENEQMKEELITCAIIDFNGIRVLIPATEISEDSKNDKKLLRNMMGAEIKFIIVEADRISEKAIGSRKKAMERLKEINIKKVQVITIECEEEKSYYSQVAAHNVLTYNGLSANWSAVGCLNFFSQKELIEEKGEISQEILYEVMDNVEDEVCIGDTIYMKCYMY